MSKKIEKIVFVFENCESVEFDKNDIIEINIRNSEEKTIKKTFNYNKSKNQDGKLKTIKSKKNYISVVIKSSAEGANDNIRRDVTYFDIHYKDGTIDSTYLSWQEADSHYCLYQIVKRDLDFTTWIFEN